MASFRSGSPATPSGGHSGLTTDGSGCPTEAELLIATDRDSPEAWRILQHARRCVACRDLLCSDQALLVAARGEVLPSLRRGCRARALLAIVLAAVHLSTASEADALLERAIAHERHAPAPRHMTIRVLPVDPDGAGTCMPWLGRVDAGGDLVAHIPVPAARRMVEAFSHPLSARAYARWRAQAVWNWEPVVMRAAQEISVGTDVRTGSVRHVDLLLDTATAAVTGLRLMGACYVYIEPVAGAPVEGTRE